MKLRHCFVWIFGKSTWFFPLQRFASILACEQTDSSRVKVKLVKKNYPVSLSLPLPPPSIKITNAPKYRQSVLVGHLFKPQNIFFCVPIL